MPQTIVYYAVLPQGQYNIEAVRAAVKEIIGSLEELAEKKAFVYVESLEHIYDCVPGSKDGAPELSLGDHSVNDIADKLQEYRFMVLREEAQLESLKNMLGRQGGYLEFRLINQN